MSFPRMTRLGEAAIRSVSRNLMAYTSNVGGALAITSRRSMTSFHERERGEEAVYMRKEDQRLLENLLKKEKSKAKAGPDGEREALMAILGSHKLPDDVIESLLQWKHH